MTSASASAALTLTAADFMTKPASRGPPTAASARIDIAAHRGPVAGRHLAHVAAPGGHAGDVGGARSQVQQNLGARGAAVERDPADPARRTSKTPGCGSRSRARHGDHDGERRRGRGGLRQGQGRMQHRVAVEGFVEAQARQRRGLARGHGPAPAAEQAREEPALRRPGFGRGRARLRPCLALPVALGARVDADRTRQALDLDEQLGSTQRRAYHLDAAGGRKVCAHEFDDLAPAHPVVDSRCGSRRSLASRGRRSLPAGRQRAPFRGRDQAGEIQQRLLRLAARSPRRAPSLRRRCWPCRPRAAPGGRRRRRARWRARSRAAADRSGASTGRPAPAADSPPARRVRSWPGSATGSAGRRRRPPRPWESIRPGTSTGRSAPRTRHSGRC